MQKKQLALLVLFNLGLVLLNIFCFTSGVFNLSLESGNTFQISICITIALMSVVLFIYVNYRMVFGLVKEAQFQLSKLETAKDYIEALEMYQTNRVFQKEIKTAISQVSRLMRKVETLDGVLFQNYQNQLSDYDGLMKIVEDSKRLVFENMKKMINRLSIFDQQEFEKIVEKDNTEALSARGALYNEHISYISQLINTNEAILLEIDKLLIEVSKLNDSEEEDQTTVEEIATITSAMKKLRVGDDSLSELEDKYK